MFRTDPRLLNTLPSFQTTRSHISIAYSIIFSCLIQKTYHNTLFIKLPPRLFINNCMLHSVSCFLAAYFHIQLKSTPIEHVHKKKFIVNILTLCNYLHTICTGHIFSFILFCKFGSLDCHLHQIPLMTNRYQKKLFQSISRIQKKQCIL